MAVYPRTGNISSLSEGEKRVLALLARGYTYASAASELGIRMGTVQTYVKRIYRKLGVTSKVGAALKFVGKNVAMLFFAVHDTDWILVSDELFNSVCIVGTTLVF